MTVEVLGRLDPEAREAVEIDRRAAAEFGAVEPGDVARMREWYVFSKRHWNQPVVELASVEEREVEAAGLPTRLRTYRPEGAPDGRALLYVHGGGWTVGSIDTHDRIVRLLAKESGITVVAVDYALAPETKFPEQIEQVAEVIGLLAAEGGEGREALAVGGDSAGAHLSLAATFARREAGRPLPAALLLLYGIFGLRDAASRRLWAVPDSGLDAAKLAFFDDCFLPGPEARHDPRYDLLANDMAGLPPCLVTAVALDPLHDDAVAMAALARGAGVPVEFRLYEGVLHGFLHLSRSVPKAMQAIRDAAAFLRQRMGAG
jgi:acetyl esterase